MEVNLLAPCSAKPPATAHNGPRLKPRLWHFGGGSKKFSFQKLLSPHLFRVETSDPTVSLADQQSGGESCSPPLPGRGAVAAVAHRVGGLRVGLRWLGLCVAVTQIVVGVLGLGGAVQRVVLLI